MNVHILKSGGKKENKKKKTHKVGVGYQKPSLGLAESGASAESARLPIYLPVSGSLCPASHSAPTAGRDRANPAGLTAYRASTGVRFLALGARAGLRATDACGGRAEVAPLELARETSARPPA